MERQGEMKIGAFQFAGNGDMEYNFAKYLRESGRRRGLMCGSARRQRWNL